MPDNPFLPRVNRQLLPENAQPFTHQSYMSPYQQFQQQYPQIDQYGRNVLSGRIAAQGLQELAGNLQQAQQNPQALEQYLGIGGITKAQGIIGEGIEAAKNIGLEVTGDGVKLPFFHSVAKNPYKKSQKMFGMDVEPAGQYLSHNPTLRESGIEHVQTGVATFKNPLIVKYGGGYDDPSNWKRMLSKEFKAKGLRLTNKLKDSGYDGIITIDEKGLISEAVDLTKGKAGTELK